MLNINSALLEQVVDLLLEFNIKCNAHEAPRCAALSFYGLSRHEDEEQAAQLIVEHFGASALLGVVKAADA